MRERSKYARTYYNKAIDSLAREAHVNKNMLEFKANSLDYDSYAEYVLDMMYKCGSYRRVKYDNHYAEFIANALYITNYFNDGLHFYVSDIPNVVACDKKVFIDILDNDVPVYIDFSYKDSNCFIHLHKVDGHYDFVVYTDGIYSSNKYDRYSSIYHYIYEPDIDKWTVSPNDIADWSQAVYSIEDGEVVFIGDVPRPELIVQITCHALYCYKYRDTLQRTNGKARRVYRQSKVHVASKTSRTGDTYVPLAEYKTVKSEYKGGHHRSPVPHSRRGFYRRSRGRGDYELINNKFVYVGEMQGHYSYVTATSVNSDKKRNNVRVYTV